MVIFWLVLFLENIIEEGPDQSQSASGQSGMRKPFAPWLGEIKPHTSLVGCKSLKWLALV